MAFDLNRFRETEFNHRTDTISVPNLKAFFGEKEEPVWKVRNLSAAELASIEAEIARNRSVRQAADLAEGEGQTEQNLDALKTLLGIIPDSVPDHHVGRLVAVELASIEPKVTRRDAVLLAERFANDFTRIYESIQQLTLMGAEEKKSPSSGETPE
ncbi:MAG: hypothetical protein HQL53_14290 [Magnetococcales bacterium]|nr:hypothetical protein [Magnetococcales bacterium]